MYTDGRYLFRTAETDDVKALWEMEKICFPENEANSFEDVKDRVEKAPEDYLIAFDQVNGKIAGYLSGVHSSSDCFLDEFFTDASLHEKGAKHCYLLSLEVLPEYRGKGLASKKFFSPAMLITFLFMKIWASSISALRRPYGAVKPGKIWFIGSNLLCSEKRGLPLFSFTASVIWQSLPSFSFVLPYRKEP